MADPTDPPIRGAPRMAWMDRFAIRRSRPAQGLLMGAGASLSILPLLLSWISGKRDSMALFLAAAALFAVAQVLTVRFAISAAKNGAWN